MEWTAQTRRQDYYIFCGYAVCSTSCSLPVQYIHIGPSTVLIMSVFYQARTFPKPSNQEEHMALFTGLHCPSSPFNASPHFFSQSFMTSTVNNSLYIVINAQCFSFCLNHITRAKTAGKNGGVKSDSKIASLLLISFCG